MNYIINYNMTIKLLIITLFLSLSISQDRSTLFSTGDGDPNPELGGYSIEDIGNGSIGAADRFYLSNEYILERLYIYLSFQPENMFDSQSVEVQINEDDNGKPGAVISTNIVNLNVNNSEGSWYSFLILDECLRTQPSRYYWLSVLPMEGTNATWIYSEEDSFVYSTTNDGGSNWSDADNGPAGSAAVAGEQIYIPPFDGGDINGDFVINILDVVQLSQYVLGNIDLDDDQLLAGDITQDGGINILDIVAMINVILNDQIVYVSEFLYEDINVNADTYGQLVGPPIYQGMITGYYFGKAGWSMCKNRFGILDDLYNELIAEGIDDVKMIGINGYQYIEDSYVCMICDPYFECNNCDGPIILPWTQDIDEDGDGDGEVWNQWNATIRDFVIVGRNGEELARINLTYNNPDPDSTCGENYETIKNLILSFR